MDSVQLWSVLHSVKKYTIIFAFTINKRKTEKLKTVALVQYTLGAFQSTKTSGLKFRQLLVANGTAFSKISKKEDNLAKYTQIFENFFRKFSFHSTLPAEFLFFSLEWFALRKFNSFRIFWKLFPICGYFQILESFG